MNYILVITSTVLLAMNFALSKQYQKNEGTTFVAGLKMTALSGILTAAVFFIISGFNLQYSLFSVIFAFAGSLCATLYSLIGFKILKSGNMALYSLFLMSGGMIMPYIFGVAFLKEPLTFVRTIGLLIILVAVILSNKTKEKLNKILLLYCVAIFVLNGFVSIINKCHQINRVYNPVDTMSFVVYSGIAKCVLSLIVFCFLKPKKSQLTFSSKNTVYVILLSVFVSGISSFFQLIGAKELPATVLYPIVTGGSIIFSSFVGKIFFKEKITRLQKLCIAICFIGTFFFL